MKLPPIVLFTKTPLQGAPAGRIGVRVDTVLVVERGAARFQEQPTKGVTVSKGEPMPCTILHLTNGLQVAIEESVEEAHRLLDRARKAWWSFWA